MKSNENLIGKKLKSNNSGEFLVLNSCGTLLNVEFVDTGFKTRVTKQNALNGRVKDKLRPSVCGVGYYGIGSAKAKVNGKNTAEYECWSKMIKRCYCKKHQAIRPTYIGCLVCDEWKDFQVFAKWYRDNYPNDGLKYQLDKDMICGGTGKLYSPETCSFVTLQDNVEISQAKKFKFKSPGGVVFDVFNISKFCREQGLSRGNMTSISLGKRMSHKGWTAA